MTPSVEAVTEAPAVHEAPGALQQREERDKLIKQAAELLNVHEAFLRRWYEGKDRLELPKDHDAEKAVIGAVLDKGRPMLAKMKELLQVEQFTHPALRAIWEAALHLDAAGSPINLLTVAQQMRAEETFAKLKSFEGEVYLSQIANGAPLFIEAIEHQARVVVQRAVQREVLELAEELHRQAQGQPDLDHLTERLRGKVRQIEEHLPRKRVPLFDKEHFLKDSLEALSRPIPNKLPFGLPALDTALGGGFPAGGVVALLAPPKHLKTGLLISRMIGWARLGQRCVYITGENTAQEIYARLSAHEQFNITNKFHGRIKHEATLAEENRKAIEWMAGMIRVISLPDEELKDPPGLFWTEAIRLVEDEVEAESKLKLPPGAARPLPPMIIIDYVEEFADRLPDRATLTEQQANKQVMRAMKNYACRRQGRVFAVCSVGRSNYSGEANLFENMKAKPQQFAAAAKHSGYIDYAAAAILALQFVLDKEGERQVLKDEAGHPCMPMKLHLAFAREGEGPITVPVLSYGGYCRFAEDTQTQDEEDEEGDVLPGLEGKILAELAKPENAAGLNINQVVRLLQDGGRGKRVDDVRKALKSLAEQKFLRAFPGPKASIVFQHIKFAPDAGEQQTLN